VHAKIMLLPGGAHGDALCSMAEDILIDVSAAFRHSFSLMRGKIGQKSLDAQGEILTDDTVAACEQCQAVLVLDEKETGAKALYDALNLPLRIRSFCVPEALCGRREAPLSLWVAQTLSVDAQTLRSAMASAFRFAREMDIRITHVAPTGPSLSEWKGMIQVQQTAFPTVAADSLSAPEAITALISAPHGLGMVLCPPYAGGILSAAATALCTRPALMYDFSFDEGIGVYAPHIPAGLSPEDEPNPIACALAVATLLRFSLGLTREAACVEAAVNNVLSAGWRTPDAARPGDPRVGAQAIVQLICEQISVAGELMGKAGIS